VGRIALPRERQIETGNIEIGGEGRALLWLKGGWWGCWASVPTVPGDGEGTIRIRSGNDRGKEKDCVFKTDKEEGNVKALSSSSKGAAWGAGPNFEQYKLEFGRKNAARGESSFKKEKIKQKRSEGKWYGEHGCHLYLLEYHQKRRGRTKSVGQEL